MAATSLADLFAFELHFEDAAKVFLAAGVGIDVFVSAESDDFVTPRLEVEFTAGEGELPWDAPITSVPALGAGEFRKYTGELTARIITDSSAGQTRANHFDYVAKTRVALLRSQDSWDATTLPYYDLRWIRQVSTMRFADGDFQVTALSYEIKFGIRDDAFPTS